MLSCCYVAANQPQTDCYVKVDGTRVINDNYCLDDSTKMSHAMDIIGWDDTYNRSRFGDTIATREVTINIINKVNIARICFNFINFYLFKKNSYISNYLRN